MARRKRASGGGPGSGDWLNTYADMVTLLLTFFILLFSMSSLDAAKFNMLVLAFASDGKASDKIVINGVAEGDEHSGNLPQGEENANEEITDVDDEKLAEIAQQLKEFLEKQQSSDSVSVSQGEGYVLIRFMNDMLFEPNSAVLKPADKEILKFVGNGIKSVENEVEMISINGHTAAIPGDPNYAVSDRLLSSDRANTVLMYFEDTIGIDPLKMQAVGWGKYKPFTTNDTEEGRSKNRRVEILLSTENLLSDQLDNIYEKLVE